MDTDPKPSDPSPADDSSGPNALPETANLSDELLKGRYLLVRELGRGNFGVSWLATDMEDGGREVVVKIPLDQRTGDAWALRHFRGEMEALARIDHPGVVGFLDCGETADGKPFLAMEYVPGKALRRLIPREGMPLSRVANIIRQIGDALTAAHEAGVWHRDLKPENIMIQSSGQGEEQVKLIDFGIATVTEGTDVPQYTKAAGTWPYMAPEQFRGKPCAASDIYSMGVVAYEMVTGIRPFRDQTVASLLVQQAEGLKVLPKALRPDLPEAAQPHIVRALSPDPSARPQQARYFGDTLATAIQTAELDTVDWEPTAPVPPPPRRWPWAIAILAALMVAAIVYWFWPRPESVAVLPFRIDDQEMAYLGLGIQGSLIDDLSLIPTLKVRARGAVQRYDGGHVDPLAAGRELRATKVIVGSVSRRGEDLRIEAELMDVRSGTRLWGRTYSQKMSSLDDTIKEFSTEVTDKLRLKLSEPLKERLRRQYAAGSGAYQDYLKGRYQMNRRDQQDFDLAVRYFKQAVEQSPSYAPAYAGLASAYGLMASFQTKSPVATLDKMREAAQQAIRLDGTLAESYTSLAFVQMQAEYKWKDARRNFQRSIELNPNWMEAHEGYALELAALGQFEEALSEIRIAEELADPGSLGVSTAHGLILYLARRNDESLALFDALAKRNKERREELTGVAIAQIRAQDYWLKQMPSDALAALDLLPKDSDSRAPLLITGYALAQQGKKAEDALRTYPIPSENVPWYYWALAHLNVGRPAEAITDLERACDNRVFEVMFTGQDPMLIPLRKEPRFRALLARMKLDILQ